MFFSLRQADFCVRCGCYKGWAFGVHGFGFRAAGHDARCASRMEQFDREDMACLSLGHADQCPRGCHKCLVFGVQGLDLQSTGVDESCARRLAIQCFKGAEECATESLRDSASPKGTKPSVSNLAKQLTQLTPSSSEVHDQKLLAVIPPEEPAVLSGATSIEDCGAAPTMLPTTSRLYGYSSPPSKSVQVLAVSGEIVFTEDLVKFSTVGDLRSALMQNASTDVQLLSHSEVLSDNRSLAELATDSDRVVITLVRVRKRFHVTISIGDLQSEGSAFGMDGQPLTLRMIWSFQQRACIVLHDIEGETPLWDLLIPLAQRLQDVTLPTHMHRGALAVCDAFVANDETRISSYVRFIQKQGAKGPMRLGRAVPWSDLGLIGVTDLASCTVASLEDVPSENGMKRIHAVLDPAASAEYGDRHRTGCQTQ